MPIIAPETPATIIRHESGYATVAQKVTGKTTNAHTAMKNQVIASLNAIGLTANTKPPSTKSAPI